MSSQYAACELCGSRVICEDCQNKHGENSLEFTGTHIDQEKATPMNTLEDLNALIFKQLDCLNDTKLSGRDLKLEIERAKATAVLGMTVVNNAKLALEARQLVNTGITLPKMIESDNAI